MRVKRTLRGVSRAACDTKKNESVNARLSRREDHIRRLNQLVPPDTGQQLRLQWR